MLAATLASLLPADSWPHHALVWFLTLSAARVLYCFAGRVFGFYSPEHYRYFTWLWAPWRWPFLNIWLPLQFWFEERRFGDKATARLSSFFEAAANLYKPGYIYVGRFRPFGIGWLGFQPVGLSGESGGHLAMFGKTGGYKTTQVLTTLGLHRGNAFVIDPKGQMAKVLSPVFRRNGKKVCLLDPAGQVRGQARHRWSPFEELHRAAERAIIAGRNAADAVVALATTMTEGLIIRYSKDNPFWQGAAKDFLLGVVLWMYTELPRQEQTLAKLYELLTVGLPEKVKDPAKETGFSVLVYEMSKSKAFGGVIAQSASSVAGSARETTANVMFTIREQLQWMKRPALLECSEASDFHLDELKTGELVLFVCAKLEDVRQNFPGWFRLLTVMALSTFEDAPSTRPDKMLFVLDEFASLGKLERLEVAANYARSAGIRLFTILQDLGQIAGGNGAPPLYDNWETFIGNTECCWWLRTDHQQTLQYLERKLGKRTIKTLLDGPARWLIFSKRIRRYDYKEREVMTANQIEHFLARGNMLVTRGLRAFKVKPDPYFKALPVWSYEPDADFRETFPRATLRRLIAWARTRRANPAPHMSYQIALAMFGLEPPYSAADVYARYEALMVSAAALASKEYRLAVAQARDALLVVCRV